MSECLAGYLCLAVASGAGCGAIFGRCAGLEHEAQTIRGVGWQSHGDLNVSKLTINRALDRLAEFDLVRRKTDSYQAP